MKRTNRRLDNNSHHTTHMKAQSPREMAITLMSRGSVSTELLFCLTAVFSPLGIPQTKPRNVGPGIRSPPSIPTFSRLAKINPTYKSSTCPVLLFSGNAWGDYRSVSINFSSRTQINEWSRSESGIAALFRHTPGIRRSPTVPLVSLVILRSANARYRSVKCKLKYNIRFLEKQPFLQRRDVWFSSIHAGDFAYCFQTERVLHYCRHFSSFPYRDFINWFPINQTSIVFLLRNINFEIIVT